MPTAAGGAEPDGTFRALCASAAGPLRPSWRFLRPCLDVSRAVGHVGRVNPPPPPLLPAPTPLREERRFPWGRVVLGGIAVVMLTVVAIPLGWRLNLRKAVEHELELCRVAGQPVTLKELAALYPPVPDAENAAIPLLEIWREDDPEFWEAWLADRHPRPERRKPIYDPDLPVLGGKAGTVGRGQPFTPAQRAAVEAWWKSNEVRMTRVATALQRPRMRFPLNFDDGFLMLLPHLSSLKTEAQHFRLRALMAAGAGDAEDALAAIEAGGAAARLLAAEPSLISQLVLVANRSSTRVSMEDFLNRLRPSTNRLDRLARAVEWGSSGNQHRLALTAERVSNRWMYSLTARQVAAVSARTVAEVVDVGHPNESGIAAGIKLMRLIGLSDSDELLYLQTMRRVVAAAEPVYTNRAEVIAACDEADVKSSGFPPRILAGMMLPAIGKVWDKFARSEAETEMARVALALERHHLDYGTLPASLDQLVPAYLPAVPTDPFSGQPLRCRRLDHGYVVYSVGPDGVDDDGRPRDSSDKQQKTWDLPFTVEREDLRPNPGDDR